MNEVKVLGDKDLFELLYSINNEETRVKTEVHAMEIENIGSVVRTRTFTPKGCSESSCFVPNTVVTLHGSGNKLEEL